MAGVQRLVLSLHWWVVHCSKFPVLARLELIFQSDSIRLIFRFPAVLLILLIIVSVVAICRTESVSQSRKIVRHLI